MAHSDNKGFLLMMVMVFMVIAAVGTFALYTLTSSNASVIGPGTVQATEGYYAAMAALRYAESVMMRDKTNVVDVINSHSGSYAWSVKTSYNFLYNDLGIRDPHDITITITATATGGIPPAYGAPYTVTADYN